MCVRVCVRACVRGLCLRSLPIKELNAFSLFSLLVRASLLPRPYGVTLPLPTPSGAGLSFSPSVVWVGFHETGPELEMRPEHCAEGERHAREPGQQDFKCVQCPLFSLSPLPPWLSRFAVFAAGFLLFLLFFLLKEKEKDRALIPPPPRCTHTRS